MIARLETGKKAISRDELASSDSHKFCNLKPNVSLEKVVLSVQISSILRPGLQCHILSCAEFAQIELVLVTWSLKFCF